MDPQRASRRYLRALVLTLLAGTGLIVVFNLRVDPLGVWRNAHLSRSQRSTVTWSRIAAAERLMDHCDVALIGSSRIVFGYGQKLPRIGRMRACNGALGGTSIRELAEVVEFIAEDTDIRAMILFVDLHMFHDGRGFNHDFTQSRFDDARSPLAYYAWTATSLGSLEHAFGQLGWRWPLAPAAVPMRPSSAETRGMIRMTMLKPEMYRRFQGPDATLDMFVDLLDVADAAGIRTMIIIPAVHAMQLEAEHAAGLWETNKQWRRFLVDEATAREIPLWDFATYHSPAVSPLPLTPLDPPNPRWSDMSHQSQLLGSETFQRIQDAMAGKDEGWDPRFGVRLTRRNLEAHLAQLEAGRQAWHAAHPEQVAWFYQVVDHLKQSEPGAAADWEVNRRRGLGEDVTWKDVGKVDLGEDAHLEL